MKQFLILFVFICLGISLLAQRPPGKIRKAFEAQYPNAKDVSWSYEGERVKEWTAMYHIESDSSTSRYDAKANWIITLVFIEV